MGDWFCFKNFVSSDAILVNVAFSGTSFPYAINFVEPTTLLLVRFDELRKKRVPVRKIAPTPRWPLKPTPHIYVPKRFLRLWSQQQDELMLGGPSGDGPEDSWDSSFVPRKTSEARNTVDDYTIRSPLPEDISPSHSEPFPTIIDTEIETSETFKDELISRSSVSFQGPSSLLNTLIFRPSPPVFLGNVETTVTIIDNKDTPFTHILPTLTVTGSSINNTSEVFIGYPEDFTIIPSHYEMDSTVFNNFSTFKHLTSSFDTKAMIFSTFEPDLGLSSNFSHISLENMISISSFYPKNLTDLESSKEMAKTISSTVTSFSTHHFFLGETIESLSSVRMSYLSRSFDEIELMSTISAINGETVKMTSDYDGVFEMQSSNLKKINPK
ncbi:uncharacterized protein TNIN_300021 [Trichonephila inaurata madagascariensis]|uniref:Uncharacterized protein n=1 Tax=Trichonephila inaurata madagascariensis TaxID=2747483 RepID=A0A8X6XCH7_9ARAC|nr:uncharacterized protein TNIN_300021 [Trichonephila inaurata madagascariensis]